MNALAEGLIVYLYLVIIITVHEFGHAWMASRCGDDTARLQGRVTLNPLAHLDPIGTVLLPALMLFLTMTGSGLARFIIGWGRPVPVNVHQLRRPHIDDLLVAMAGPAMNVVIALVALSVARIGVALDVGLLQEIGVDLARFSMYLCFFNLIPVPPLDGSYVLKHLVGMSNEAFWKFCQFGFFIVILVIQIPWVREVLAKSTMGSLDLMAKLLMFPGA